MNITLELKKIALAASIALLAVPAFAQTTATTDPVGFITLNVTGTGAGTDPVLSFKGLSMTRPVEYQGSAETVGTNTLVDDQAVWVDSQFNGANGKYFVELTSGTRAGTSYDIASTTAATKTITLVQNFPSGVLAGVSFKVRKHWTIASVFGPANEAGLFPNTNTSLADQIQIFNGTGYDNYYYRTALGWRKTTSPVTDQSGVVLYPEDGLIVRRTQSSGLNIVLMGAVKTGVTSIPVASNTNIIGSVAAAPMTLASSGLYTGDPNTGFFPNTNTSLADQILLWNGVGYDSYYYRTSLGWRKTTSPVTDQSNVQIPVGSAFIIIRRSATGFDWVVPQHPAVL